MRPGLPASVVLHAALIAWIVVGLPWKRTTEDAVAVVRDPDLRPGREHALRHLLGKLAAHVGVDVRAVRCVADPDRKSTRLNSSHNPASRMPSSA
jgi:hypothetical protein